MTFFQSQKSFTIQIFCVELIHIWIISLVHIFKYLLTKVVIPMQCFKCKLNLISSMVFLFKSLQKPQCISLFRIDKFTPNDLKIVNQYLHLNALLVMYTSEWTN